MNRNRHEDEPSVRDGSGPAHQDHSLDVRIGCQTSLSVSRTSFRVSFEHRELFHRTEVERLERSFGGRQDHGTTASSNKSRSGRKCSFSWHPPWANNVPSSKRQPQKISTARFVS
jgi:hypothetical protein